MEALVRAPARWWAEGPIYLYSTVCALLCIAIWAAHGVAFDPLQASTSLTLFYASGLALLMIDIVWRLWRDRPISPLAFLRDRYLTLDALGRMIAAIPMILLSALICPIFSSLKSLIPRMNDYSWDPVFIAWDRAIFFGNDAWQVLQPLIGFPIVTAFIALSYHIWILLLFPGVIYFALYRAPSREVKRRFFVSYAMAWSIIGGLMATLLASVGPAFAGPLVGIDTFAAQMDYLRAANEEYPIMVLSVQELLLERFYLDERGLGSGITAMPSMHCAIAALYWLAMRHVSKTAGRWFFGFFVLIWIGSVHTGYHYAVDGLVSLIAITVIWWASKRIFAWWDRLPAPFAQPALRTNTVPAE